MDIDMILVRTLALKQFAEETKVKLDELEAYIKLGILTESMKNEMERVIAERIIYTEDELLNVFNMLN